MGFDITFGDDGSYTISRDGYGAKSFLDANELREELRSIAHTELELRKMDLAELDDQFPPTSEHH